MGSTPNQYQQSGPIGNYPSQWWGNEFQGGNYFQPQQQLWQNPFSPMSAADWAALKEKYNPTQAPAPPPQPGTIEHAESIAGVPRSRIDYPGYMQAMATLYGTKTNLGVPQGYQGGEGGGGYYYQTPTGERMYSPIAYEYQGKYYEPHQGALDWFAQGYGTGQGKSWGLSAPERAVTDWGQVGDYMFGDFKGSLYDMVKDWQRTPNTWDLSWDFGGSAPGEGISIGGEMGGDTVGDSGRESGNW